MESWSWGVGELGVGRVALVSVELVIAFAKDGNTLYPRLLGSYLRAIAFGFPVEHFAPVWG